MQRGMKKKERERKKAQAAACCVATSHRYTRTHTHTCLLGQGRQAVGRRAGGACQRTLVKSQLHIMSSSAFSLPTSFLPCFLPCLLVFATCVLLEFYLQHFARAQAARHFAPRPLLLVLPLCPGELQTRTTLSLSPNATLTFTIFPLIYFARFASSFLLLLPLAAPSFCCSSLLLLLFPSFLPSPAAFPDCFI